MEGRLRGRLGSWELVLVHEDLQIYFSYHLSENGIDLLFVSMHYISLGILGDINK